MTEKMQESKAEIVRFEVLSEYYQWKSQSAILDADSGGAQQRFLELYLTMEELRADDAVAGGNPTGDAQHGAAMKAVAEVQTALMDAAATIAASSVSEVAAKMTILRGPLSQKNSEGAHRHPEEAMLLSIHRDLVALSEKLDAVSA